MQAIYTAPIALKRHRTAFCMDLLRSLCAAPCTAEVNDCPPLEDRMCRCRAQQKKVTTHHSMRAKHNRPAMGRAAVEGPGTTALSPAVIAPLTSLLAH